ncbi:MAG: hypothetical protein RPU63_01960 [Candidatus Sedimenticola sp. (ex Thyasira tokunagai)]
MDVSAPCGRLERLVTSSRPTFPSLTSRLRLSKTAGQWLQPVVMKSLASGCLGVILGRLV